MRAWLLVLMLVPLAGCLDDAGTNPSESLDTGESPPEPSPVRVSPIPADGTDGAGNASGRGGVVLQAEGGAGSYLVAYQPFPARVESMEYDVSWTFEVAGSGRHAFWTAPTTTYGTDGGFRLGTFNPFENELLRTFEGGLSLAREGSVSTRCSCGVDGLLWVAAADGPWRMSVDVRWGDGPQTTPTFLSVGGNATFEVGAERVGLGAVAGSLELRRTVGEPGWTHVEVLGLRAQPDGARQSEFHMPNGFEVGGLGYQQGYNAPLLGGSAGSSNIVDYAGTPRGTAGDLEASVVFAEASIDRDLGWLHLPGAGVPEGLVGEGYQGSNWPFEDVVDGGP